MNYQNEIENLILLPKEGLSLFRLEESLNSMINLSKSLSLITQQADVVISMSLYDPIIIFYQSLGIKLFFDSYYQKLELIEIEMSHSIRNIGLMFNGVKLIYSKLVNVISYNTVQSVLDLITPPVLICNNEKVLLRSHGVSFIFNNIEQEYPNNTNSLVLEKILIYKNNHLKDSITNTNNLVYNITKLSRESILFKDENISIMSICEVYHDRIEIKSRKEEKDYNITISIGDFVDSLLFKLKSPSFILRKKPIKQYSNQLKTYPELEKLIISENSNNLINNNIFLSSLEDDYFLCYYSLGLEFMIDKYSEKIKKIIIHNNNPLSSLFGIYSRCNFILKIDKDYFKTINEDENSSHLNNYFTDSRKGSETSNFLNDHSGDYEYKIESQDTIKLNKMTSEYQRSSVESFSKEELLGKRKKSIFNNSNSKQINVTSRRISRKGKYDIDKGGVKSILKLNTSFNNLINSKNNTIDQDNSLKEINESQISIPNQENIISYTLLPCSNIFKEMLNNLNHNSYFYYMRTEPKTGIMSHYYIFDCIGIELMENSMIESITLFTSN